MDHSLLQLSTFKPTRLDGWLRENIVQTSRAAHTLCKSTTRATDNNANYYANWSTDATRRTLGRARAGSYLPIGWPNQHDQMEDYWIAAAGWVAGCLTPHRHIVGYTTGTLLSLRRHVVCGPSWFNPVQHNIKWIDDDINSSSSGARSRAVIKYEAQHRRRRSIRQIESRPHHIQHQTQYNLTQSVFQHSVWKRLVG